MCRSLDILLILHLSQVLPPMVVAFPSDLSCEAAIFLVEVFENFGINLKDVRSVRICLSARGVPCCGGSRFSIDLVMDLNVVMFDLLISVDRKLGFANG